MLGKQRSQMNQSVCYDINQITDWRHLIEIEIDNKEISIEIREQEQDTRQILLRSLVLTIPMEAILEIQSEDNIPFKNPITFQHFFSIWIDSHGSQPSQPAVNSPKAMYVELAGLSKKAIDCALKSDKQQELLNIFKAFIYDVKSGLEPKNFTDVINPVVIKHKGQPPKRLISSVEKVLNREKRVLKDVSNSNVIEDNNTSTIIEDFTNDTKGRKCSKCKQYRHYAKTCQNVI
ncbi:unnamed protein product [Rhizophagus irregularis]|uniref:CCHC-type domain-containing protein n=1 Tax=Rhizophagus irregularis TaxID=588596 RepID=A0A916EGJ8_9GLOM|nr:unnamed protein product [Rhizophagus irregularis]